MRRTQIGHKPDMFQNKMDRETFVQHLRDALNHLQDPERLRQSPLAALLGLSDRFDTFSALQRLLVDAVESLEPDADEPSQSRAWRTYESLYYRYVQQFTQQEVADQLGIGPRHLRREQHAALEALADVLWRQYELAHKVGQGSGSSTLEDAEEQASPVSDELAWLKDVTLGGPTDAERTVSTALELARPLAERHRVRLETMTDSPLPGLAVHPVAASQVLLSLLTIAIHRARGGEVCVSARALAYEAEIVVCGAGETTSGPQALSPEDADSLDMARQLIGLSGGKLSLAQENTSFRAALHLPALNQLPVLVIDDSADTQQLLQRYAAGTRYRVIGTRDPEQAIQMAKEFAPQVVVLDVMMPQVDGWQVLGRLRQHPVTEHTPIIVCTILSQEELALCLGANAFLRKPINRQRFLAVLARVLQEERERLPVL
jgi:CheY-like chemotaxis protein